MGRLRRFGAMVKRRAKDAGWFRTYVPEFQYSWVRRGRLFFGYCDHGCESVARAHPTHLRAAMGNHWREKHGGQGTLFATSPTDDPPF